MTHFWQTILKKDFSNDFTYNKGTKKYEKLSATYNIRLKSNEIALSNLANYNPSFFGY